MQLTEETAKQLLGAINLNNRLLKEAKKPCWVKAETVFEFTGWDKERLRRERNNQTITWKKENGYFYDLNSIHPLFLKKTA